AVARHAPRIQRWSPCLSRSQVGAHQQIRHSPMATIVGRPQTPRRRETLCAKSRERSHPWKVTSAFIRTFTGLPFFVAGLNRHCSNARTALSSRFGSTERRILTIFGVPSSWSTTSSTTVPLVRRVLGGV